MMLEKWKKCKKCGLSKYRRKVVIGEGSVPADIMFLGEGPGRAGDMRGLPFQGPSGRILRKAIKEVFGEDGPSWYITNTVGCRPTYEKGGPNQEPTEDEVKACMPRVKAIHKRVSPKVVVFLGRVSELYYHQLFPDAIMAFHPSYVLRMGGFSSKEYKHFKIVLERAVEEVSKNADKEKKEKREKKEKKETTRPKRKVKRIKKKRRE